MATHKDGEYMNLVWDGSPDAYFIRGHVSDGVGKLIIADEAYLDVDELKKLSKAEHRYGRWSCQGDNPEGCSQVLREYNGPGRGRFKITVFSVYVGAECGR